MALASLAHHYLPTAGKFSKSTLQKGLQKLGTFSNNATIKVHQDNIQEALNTFGRHIKSGQGLTTTQLEEAKHKIVTKAGGNLSSTDKENIKTVLDFYSQKRMRQIDAMKQMGRLRQDAYGESEAAKQHAKSVGSINNAAGQHSASISDSFKKKSTTSINTSTANRHTSSISSIRPGGAAPKTSVGIRPTGISLVK